MYIYNKTSIKRNILTIKQNTSGSGSAPRQNSFVVCFCIAVYFCHKAYLKYENEGSIFLRNVVFCTFYFFSILTADLPASISLILKMEV